MQKFTSKGGSRRREKILLMIMRVLAPSPATASDATTTSGLGSGLGRSSKKKVVVISNSFYVVFCLIVVQGQGICHDRTGFMRSQGGEVRRARKGTTHASASLWENLSVGLSGSRSF